MSRVQDSGREAFSGADATQNIEEPELAANQVRRIPHLTVVTPQEAETLKISLPPGEDDALLLLNRRTGTARQCPAQLWMVYRQLPVTFQPMPVLAHMVGLSLDDQKTELSDFIKCGLKLGALELKPTGTLSEPVASMRVADYGSAELNEVWQHIQATLAKVSPCETPFPYFYATNFLPPAYFARVCANFPSRAQMGTPMTGYPERSAFFLSPGDWTGMEGHQKAFWQRFTHWLTSLDFQEALLGVFRKTIEQRFAGLAKPRYRHQAYLCQDHKHYSIRPHTGHLRKVLSLKFNFPRDTRFRALGTHLYVPLNKDFIDQRSAVLYREGGYELSRRFAFEDFETVAVAEYLPNSVFAFCHTPHSFHGVPPIEVDLERDALQFSILLDNLEEVYPQSQRASYD